MHHGRLSFHGAAPWWRSREGSSGSPFRDEFGAAVELADRLGRENAVLRDRLDACEGHALPGRATWCAFDSVVLWASVTVVVLCGGVLVYLVATWQYSPSQPEQQQSTRRRDGRNRPAAGRKRPMWPAHTTATVQSTRPELAPRDASSRFRCRAQAIGLF
jgi:hypothetical protein